MIDDCNQWMGGVDKADQFISCHCPNPCCRRVWMPIFLHCLVIARVNSFVTAQKTLERQGAKAAQKNLIAEFVESLNDRASAFSCVQSAQRRREVAAAGPKQKQRRMRKSPKLPNDCFKGARSNHVDTVAKETKQKACIHCSCKWKKPRMRATMSCQRCPTSSECIPFVRCTFAKVVLIRVIVKLIEH